MSAWVPGVWLFLVVLHVVVHISKHGEARGPYDGPTAFISGAIYAAFFWWGGFFAPLFGGTP